MNEITQILNSIEDGDPQASTKLLPLLYEELRQLARHKMANEKPGQTLQPTALVHEAWLRLAGHENIKWESRAHFFGAAAEAMRRILINNARRKSALRHGGGQQPVDLLEVQIAAPTKDDKLLALDEALQKLEAEDKAKAELVKLRYFAGMKIEEAAKLLDISLPTANRWWAYARAWLFREIAVTNREPKE